MHCIVSWDVSEGAPPRSMVEQKLLDVLAPYAWVRPLTTFYIVPLPDQLRYNMLVQQLQGVAQQWPMRIHIVISPLMSGGQYMGFLPGDLWPAIAQRTI